jgi:hypothetical protein
MELVESLNLRLAEPPPLSAPMSEELLRILQPLTDEELLACFREVRLDEVDHIRAKHSRRSDRPGSHPVMAFEALMELQTEREFREVFWLVVSRAVTEYWSHVTEGHPHHQDRQRTTSGGSSSGASEGG